MHSLHKVDKSTAMGCEVKGYGPLVERPHLANTTVCTVVYSFIFLRPLERLTEFATSAVGR